MNCSCCGRRKKLMESFEDIGKGGKICVDCSDILYRIHDAVTEKNAEEFETRKKEISSYLGKKATKEFKAWVETEFLARNKMEDAKK